MTYKVHLIPVTHTHTHVNTHTHTHCIIPLQRQQTFQEMHFFNIPKHMPHHQIYTSILFFFFFHYSQIAYWILNIVFTLRLIEAFCFQTVSCNVFKQKTRSAIHCLQPQSVISTTTEMETMCSMRTEFISKLLSLSLLRRQKKMLA